MVPVFSVLEDHSASGDMLKAHWTMTSGNQTRQRKFPLLDVSTGNLSSDEGIAFHDYVARQFYIFLHAQFN